MKILITGGCGYIGSALYHHLDTAGHTVGSFDKLDRGAVAGIKNSAWDYRNVAPGYIGADVIIHLAGHSSVQSCEADPWGAVDNNLTGFISFLKMLAGLENPPLLLWASSGSVLSDVVSLYDATKRTLEALVPRLYPKSIGLRFASVCGVSPNMRDDLILNAMVNSAVTKGVINMANPLISKPILGINDLCTTVAYLSAGYAGDARPIQSWSLCSATTSPLEAALAVHEATGARIARQPRSNAYDFKMTPNMEMMHGNSETLESIIADLVAHYSAEKAEAA